MDRWSYLTGQCHSKLMYGKGAVTGPQTEPNDALLVDFGHVGFERLENHLEKD